MDAFESRFFTAEDGLRLHACIYPTSERLDAAKDGLPVICLPGLSRNVRDFHQFALLVAQDPTAPRRVIALDYRGRGLSDYDPNPENYNIGIECRDVITVCTALGISRAIFVGTSRGGLILHIMAALTPDLIAGAVLNDLGPEIEAEGLREIRDYLSRRSSPANIEEAAEGLARIHGSAFPALSRADWLEMAEALYAEKDGRLVTDYDPKLTDQLQAIDFSKPLATLWPQFELLAKVPLLVVRGDRSRLLSRATLARMAAHSSRVKTVNAPGQGHAPLLHHPGIFSSVRDFLVRLSG
ncbi:alpha/beta hydrolase [Sinorhizobium sp. RAC02]|uniref:alpha/beta fold hydrolase n=1 Tax=Sinorhizobium sp. RAC02 TaxID=1842534 RepID=UPI00083DD534|nr:alpha/beta hydrolase [Sinorhizobium sp. RAC02]AOF89917.1 alpha/beta hydrolase family protein [Sinorhizobium sp. RAC02]